MTDERWNGPGVGERLALGNLPRARGPRISRRFLAFALSGCVVWAAFPVQAAPGQLGVGLELPLVTSLSLDAKPRPDNFFGTRLAHERGR